MYSLACNYIFILIACPADVIETNVEVSNFNAIHLRRVLFNNDKFSLDFRSLGGGGGSSGGGVLFTVCVVWYTYTLIYTLLPVVCHAYTKRNR